VVQSRLGISSRESSWTGTFPLQNTWRGRMRFPASKQQDGEVLYDAWERFKLLLKRYPGHKFSEMDIIQAFTTGLKPETRMLLDASA